jgi:ketopantoate reductase
MQKTYKILIMGASYGSLLGTKLALAGHYVTLICLPVEVEAFNKDGAIVRMPIKGPRRTRRDQFEESAGQAVRRRPRRCQAR